MMGKQMTFAVTTEEGGIWRDLGEFDYIHSIWFEDGRQWDAINGFRASVRPVTFAARIDKILHQTHEKLDAVEPEFRRACRRQAWEWEWGLL